MKTTPSSFLLIAAILCEAVLFQPTVHGQPTEVFLKTKANAEKGSAYFQYLLGESYENGMGVEKDYVEAVKWYRKAADQNDAQAQASLGRCYEYGRGVEKDYAAAYAWLKLAAKTVEYAAKRRDVLEKQMSPLQIAAAQKRTEELWAMIDAKLKSGGALGQVSDPLLAAGEQALVGSYKLDNVLLGPGMVLLPGSIFEGMGDTREQATKRGLLTEGQAATLQREDCTMQIVADHTFTISNLPVADLSGTLSIKGSWSLAVYQAFGAYGYRISMKDGPKGDLALAKFFNADKPEPPVIDIVYKEGQLGEVDLRFAKTNTPPFLRPRR